MVALLLGGEEVRVLGVVLDEGGHRRALRDDLLAAGPDVVQRPTDQLARQALAPVGLVHHGVREDDDAVGSGPELGEPGHLTVDQDLVLLLVVVAPSGCDAGCERQLLLQRQLREMLGRERDRLDKIWFVTDEGPLAAPLRTAVEAAPATTVTGLRCLTTP